MEKGRFLYGTAYPALALSNDAEAQEYVQAARHSTTTNLYAQASLLRRRRNRQIQRRPVLYKHGTPRDVK